MKKLFTFIAAMLLSVNSFASEEVKWGGLEWKTYENIGQWGGTWSGVDNLDWTAYDYVWMKYSGMTGAVNFGINYSEWVADHGSWVEFKNATAACEGAEGYVAIKLDKTTTYVTGDAEVDGQFKGDVYAKHVREIFIQGTSAEASSITIEGIWVGTEKEYKEAAGIGEEPNVKWMNLTLNGDCEGAPESGLIGKGTMKSGAEVDVYSFVCRESGKPDYVNIIDGAGKNGTRAAVVHSVDNAANEWDTQFFITTSHKFEAGQKVHLKFDYKADANATVGTQWHALPGDYNFYIGIGDLSFKPEWQTYDEIITLNAQQASGDGGVTQTLAFNLNNNKALATNFYFDNIEFCIDETVATDEDKEIAARIGGGSGDQELILNGDCEGEDGGCLLSKNGDGGGQFIWNVQEGVGVNGSKAAVVHSISNAANGWDSQFFIYAKDHQFALGEKYKFTMWIRADKPAAASAQAHNAPGEYKHWRIITDGSNVNFTTEWTEFTYEGTVDADLVGVSTIAFNLNDDKTLENNYYFDNISWLLLSDDTAVELVTATRPMTGIRYNLAGQKVDASYKGIVIQDGKKFIVK